MNAEDIKHLEEYGFKPFFDHSDIMGAFEHPIYGLDANMYTQGDHSDERTVIMYAKKGDFEGLCYANSLIEEMMVSYAEDHGMDEIISELEAVGIFVELKFISIFPMITISREEIGDLSPNGMFKFHVSDMIKAAGILDYLVQKRYNYLRENHNE